MAFTNTVVGSRSQRETTGPSEKFVLAYCMCLNALCRRVKNLPYNLSYPYQVDDILERGHALFDTIVPQNEEVEDFHFQSVFDCGLIVSDVLKCSSQESYRLAVYFPETDFNTKNGIARETTYKTNSDASMKNLIDFLKLCSNPIPLSSSRCYSESPPLTNQDGFIFFSTDANISLAFWRAGNNDKYIVFDPTSVDELRRPTAMGRARIFECDSIESLAQCLVTSSQDVRSWSYKVERYRVTELPQEALAFACVSISTGSQATFGSAYTRNKQCTANSVIAICHKVILNQIFTSIQVDEILCQGDKLYELLKPERFQGPNDFIYLDADDIPFNLTIKNTIQNNDEYKVKLTKYSPTVDFELQNLAIIRDGQVVGRRDIADEMVTIAIYDGSTRNQYYEQFLRNLNVCFHPTTLPQPDNRDGFTFIAHALTISFWKANHRYYVFDPHAVDESRITIGPPHGKARLFECFSLEDLAHCLLRGHTGGSSTWRYDLARWRIDECMRVNEEPQAFNLLETFERLMSPPRSPTLSPVAKKKKRPEFPTSELHHTLDPLGIYSSPFVCGTMAENADNVEDRAEKAHYWYEKPVHPEDGNRSASSSSYEPSSPFDPGFDRPPMPSEIDEVASTIPSPIRSPPSDISAQTSDVESIGKPVKKMGRPKKKVRGRPKSGKTRKEISRDASKKYRDAHPDQAKESKKKIIKDKPDSVKKSRKDYTEKKPESVKKSKKDYAEKNPEKVSKSRKSYVENHPEAVLDSREKYTQEHPDRVRQSLTDYVETHPEVTRDIQSHYNTGNRKLPLKLRKYPVICEIGDDNLIDVDLHELKAPGSLLSEETYKCPYCDAPLFEEERGRRLWCCSSGTIKRAIGTLPPIEEDCEFYDDEEFLKHARAYNNTFAFTAFGTSGKFRNPSGLHFIKVQGKVYHRLFPLDYSASNAINNTRLWIEDQSERLRIANNLSLDEENVQAIEEYITRVNPFVGQIRQLHREEAQDAYIVFERTNRASHGVNIGDVPTGENVTALIKYGAVEGRQVVIWKTGETRPQIINILEPCYEPLQYPLIFPHGTAGWSPNIRMSIHNRAGDKTLTMLKYYRYRYFSEPRLQRFRRLSEEYFVDGWARIEENNLYFIRHNQDKVMRVANREEFDETIAGETGGNYGAIGKIYLPASFTHGPRYMQVQYYNAMALVNRKGIATYFLTITCNPKWNEIVSSLYPRQKPHDRPDLSIRVFNLKLQYLKSLLDTGRLLGKVQYRLHVIEYQKRGLPHAHMAIRIENGGPTSSIEIDRVIRATIPSADVAGGRLQQLVLTHMIHNECGPNNPNAQCMVNGKCSKGFPKDLNETTYINNRGFPVYRRTRDVVVEVRTRGGRVRLVDDRWVVPYNPALLLMFGCHINLEISSGAATMKYLMKYAHKDVPAANVGIFPAEQVSYVTDTTGDRIATTADGGNQTSRRVNDEIDAYVEMRFLSSSEAMHRLFEIPVRESVPTVQALVVHLPEKDNIVFFPGQESRALDRQASKLTLYLERTHVPELDDLTYIDFYENYFVEASPPANKNRAFFIIPNRGRFIYKRERGQCICRINFLSPNLGEVFYLRMLLHRFAARSYEALRTVNGVMYDTFQEAAEAHGLLSRDSEYTQAMTEAVTFKIGNNLRFFFFTLIINGAPAQILWTQFRDQLIDDFLRQNPDNVDLAETKALLDIKRMLEARGKSLSDFGLREVEDGTTEVSRERIRWDTSRCLGFYNSWVHLLNPAQKSFAAKVLEGVASPNTNTTKLFFLDGPGGTGKTLVLNVIAAKLRSEGKIVLPCAFTGIAALNYEGGVTAHSLFKLPFEIKDVRSATCNISASSQRAELLRNADLIIWDEISTVHNVLFEAVDRSLRDIHQNTSPFGGKTIIFAGDFRQIPPIVESYCRENVVAASVKFSSLWPLLSVTQLTTAQRLIGDTDFSDFLLEIGEGRAPQVTINKDDVISLRNVESVSTLIGLINHVFPQEVLNNPVECCNRAILSLTNRNIKEINVSILKKCAGEILHFYSADTHVAVDTGDPYASSTFYPPELLHSSTASGVPDHDLQLKIGSVCSIMRNICFQRGLVNGTKVIIKRTSKFVIEVEVPGRSDLQSVLIPRIDFEFDAARNGVKIHRKQFPLRLAYAMTINKIQGQTLERVGVDLRGDVFSHGQLYVALSRVRHLQNLRVIIPPERIMNGECYTKNLVFEDLIRQSSD